MFELVGISIFGSNADTSLSDQHYRQHIFDEPSPYSAFLAVVHDWSISPSFFEWIAALSSRYKKLTSAGHQLFQTFQSELRRQPEVLDTRHAPWINSYPPSWHWLLSQHSSTTWKLVDSMLESSLSSRSSDTIPDLGTWLAAVTWLACINDQSLEVGERVGRLNARVRSTILSLVQNISTPLSLLHPTNTDAVKFFQRKIKNSSHTCWDGHDPVWYVSAVSYLNDDNVPEFVPGPRHAQWRKYKGSIFVSECKACSLVDHAHEFTKALSNSSNPSAEFSTLSAAMVNKSQCEWLDD